MAYHDSMTLASKQLENKPDNEAKIMRIYQFIKFKLLQSEDNKQASNLYRPL
uniref:Uncharacterized protein n=1 Tax=Daucus carota subsp. sativus TaxID=79200 RepID=A0A166F1S7_DAUCS